MAVKLVGRALATTGAVTDVDASARNPVMLRAFGDDGNEYIYLKGVASTIAGSVVTFDEVGVTTLIVADAIGPVAVAMAVVDAVTKYGWYCIYGTVLTDMVANVADNAPLGRETTNGKVGDGKATGDEIVGMISRGATTAAALALAQLNYPYASNAFGA